MRPENEQENCKCLGLTLVLPESQFKVDEELRVTPLMESISISRPRMLDPEKDPFIVMSATYWNAWQAAMDRNGVRELVRAELEPVKPFAQVMKKSHIIKLPDVRA